MTLFEIQQLLRQNALAVFIGVVLVAAGIGAVALAAPGAIRKLLQSAFLIAIDDLVAGLARDSELSTQRGHALAVLRWN